MRPKVNDFFCGAGGVGLGFMQAGYDVVWACDFDKYAVETYKHNVGDHVVQADIKKLAAEDIPHADVWAFGFPCQDLSVAGKQKGFRFVCKDCGEEWGYDSDEHQDGIKCPKCSSENYQAASRSGMFFEMMRLLDETVNSRPADIPKALFVENVKGLKPYIPALEAELTKRGYTAHIQMFNSKYWGVPQSRERFFIVGLLDEVKGFSFPEEQHETVPKLSTILEKNVDEKYYIADEKAQTIIKQALEKLETLGKVHATLTPDRENKRQNGPRAKEDEREMFTITAQDIHGVIIDDTYGFGEIPRVYQEAAPTLRSSRQGLKVVVDEDVPDIEKAVCEESGLLNPDGCGKTLRVGGGGIDEKAQLPTRFSEAVRDGVAQKQRNGNGTFFGISPTLLASDHKGPHLVIETQEDKNE